MDTYVPLPTNLIYCTSCGVNVEPDAQGRCSCGLLGIYPEGEPRPDIVTDTLIRLQEASRQDRASRQGVHRQPKNVRQLRARQLAQ